MVLIGSDERRVGIDDSIFVLGDSEPEMELLVEAPWPSIRYGIYALSPSHVICISMTDYSYPRVTTRLWSATSDFPPQGDVPSWWARLEVRYDRLEIWEFNT